MLPSYTYPIAAAIRSSHGLWLPTALGGIRGPLIAGQSLPATFRLQGLVTLLTAFSLESRAGFVSHRQRSWDSPFEGFPFREISTAFSAGRDPHGGLAERLFRRTRRQTGPTSPAFWVLVSRKCLANARVFKPAPAGAFLGFRPFRAILPKPEPGFRRASSHTLRGFWRLLAESAGVSEYRSALASPPPGKTPKCPPAEDYPFGVLAPARS